MSLGDDHLYIGPHFEDSHPLHDFGGLTSFLASRISSVLPSRGASSAPKTDLLRVAGAEGSSASGAEDGLTSRTASRLSSSGTDILAAKYMEQSRPSTSSGMPASGASDEVDEMAAQHDYVKLSSSPHSGHATIEHVGTDAVGSEGPSSAYNKSKSKVPRSMQSNQKLLGNLNFAPPPPTPALVPSSVSTGASALTTTVPTMESVTPIHVVSSDVAPGTSDSGRSSSTAATPTPASSASSARARINFVRAGEGVNPSSAAAHQHSPSSGSGSHESDDDSSNSDSSDSRDDSSSVEIVVDRASQPSRSSPYSSQPQSWRGQDSDRPAFERFVVVEKMQGGKHRVMVLQEACAFYKLPLPLYEYFEAADSDVMKANGIKWCCSVTLTSPHVSQLIYTNDATFLYSTDVAASTFTIITRNGLQRKSQAKENAARRALHFAHELARFEHESPPLSRDNSGDDDDNGDAVSALSAYCIKHGHSQPEYTNEGTELSSRFSITLPESLLAAGTATEPRRRKCTFRSDKNVAYKRHSESKRAAANKALKYLTSLGLDIPLPRAAEPSAAAKVAQLTNQLGSSPLKYPFEQVEGWPAHWRKRVVFPPELRPRVLRALRSLDGNDTPLKYVQGARGGRHGWLEEFCRQFSSDGLVKLVPIDEPAAATPDKLRDAVPGGRERARTETVQWVVKVLRLVRAAS